MKHEIRKGNHVESKKHLILTLVSIILLLISNISCSFTKSKDYYVNGLKVSYNEFSKEYTGKVLSYYKNNQIKSELYYINGLRHGTCTWWYESGNKCKQVSFVNGKKHGPYIMWESDESIMIEEVWHNGKLIKIKKGIGGFFHYPFYISVVFIIILITVWVDIKLSKKRFNNPYDSSAFSGFISGLFKVVFAYTFISFIITFILIGSTIKAYDYSFLKILDCFLKLVILIAASDNFSYFRTYYGKKNFFIYSVQFIIFVPLIYFVIVTSSYLLSKILIQIQESRASLIQTPSEFSIPVLKANSSANLMAYIIIFISLLLLSYLFTRIRGRKG